MTQFHQEHQQTLGYQQNAGRDIINNNFPQIPWKPPMMLPPRAQSFVGRKEDIEWLLQQLMSERGMTLALCGPGGMGKTALAAEALARLVDQEDWLTRFPGGIFYHSFYAFPSLDIAFEELARLCGEDPGADSRRAAMRGLSRYRTLLVFDGVEVLENVHSLRELGGKHIVLLLSRRQSDAPDLSYCRFLDLLSHNQATTLLQNLAGSRATDLPCVERLVKYIGGYPLALQLIGNYLSSRQEDVADYLQWLEQEGITAIDFGKHEFQSVSILLQRTYDSLPPNEQQIFILLGLLAPVPFPLELVQGILELSERVVRQALGSLVNLSVLRRPKQGYEISHPLIYTFAKELLVSHMRTTSSVFYNIIATWQEKSLMTLTTYFNQSDPYDKIFLDLWYPHVFPLLPDEYSIAELYLVVAVLLNAAGFSLYTQGKYGESELLLLYSLKINEHMLGPMHPNTALGLNNLAALYAAQGKYVEAEPLYQRALAIREQQLGAEHPNTARSLNNLADLYCTQGKYVEAEPLHQRALTINEQQLGAAHLDTARSLNHLASLYQLQGKYKEAEPLYQRALAIREQQLGAEHPSTVLNLNNLAALYCDQGKYIEAELLHQRVLAINEQQLGAKHPDTARSLNNLALLYREQGRYKEAEPLYKRALAIYEQILGPTHPDTALGLNNLAVLYTTQRKYTKAEPLYKRALAIDERMLGGEHPDTASIMNNLAELYREQGKYKDAEPLYKRALAIYKHISGCGHPDTARCLNNLALLYAAQKKHTEAEALYKRALVIYVQVLGATHSCVAGTFFNLANLHQARENYKQAEFFFLKAIAIDEKVYGTDHPAVANDLDALAELLMEMQREGEAQLLKARARAIREKFVE